MDPKEYDRIADLLMQIRKKIDNLTPSSTKGKWTKTHYLQLVHDLLIHTDTMAEADAKGWL